MFDLIGKGLAAMHEGPAKKPDLDLDALEKLAAQATPGPWYPANNHTAYDGYGESVFSTEQTHNLDNNLAYIVAACNALPDLIAENRELRKKVQQMDCQMVWLAKQVCDSLSPQEWINRAEEATKEEAE